MVEWFQKQFKNITKVEASIEILSQLNLEQQYRDQVSLLIMSGLLQPLPQSREFGVIGVDGQEYPLPTLNEVKQRFLKYETKLQPALAQQFTTLLLVPVASRVYDFFAGYKNMAQTVHTVTTFTEQELDVSTPLSISTQSSGFWEDFGDGDPSTKMRYYPDHLFRSKYDPRGISKKEFLLAHKGWQLLLVREDVDGIKLIKDNYYKSTKVVDLIKAVDTPPLPFEVGLTIESWVMLAIQVLKSDNVLIDSRPNTMLLGSCFDSSEFSNIPWSVLFDNNNFKYHFLATAPMTLQHNRVRTGIEVPQ